MYRLRMWWLLCKGRKYSSSRGQTPEEMLSQSTEGGTTFPDAERLACLAPDFEAGEVDVESEVGAENDMIEVVEEYESTEDEEEEEILVEEEEVDEDVQEEDIENATFILRDLTPTPTPSSDNSESEEAPVETDKTEHEELSELMVFKPKPNEHEYPELTTDEADSISDLSSLVQRVAKKEVQTQRLQRVTNLAGSSIKLQHSHSSSQNSQNNYDADAEPEKYETSDDSSQEYEEVDGGLIRISVERNVVIEDRPKPPPRFLPSVPYNEQHFICSCQRASCFGCRPVFAGEGQNEIQFVPSHSTDGGEDDDVTRFELDNDHMLEKVRTISFADEVHSKDLDSLWLDGVNGRNFDSDRTFQGSSSGSIETFEYENVYDNEL